MVCQCLLYANGNCACKARDRFLAKAKSRAGAEADTPALRAVLLQLHEQTRLVELLLKTETARLIDRARRTKQQLSAEEQRERRARLKSSSPRRRKCASAAAEAPGSKRARKSAASPRRRSGSGAQQKIDLDANAQQ